MKAPLLAGLLATATAAAWACGTCVEDRMAATYDHAVIQRAAAAGQRVVFCAVLGPMDAPKLKSAALRVRGVEPATVRVASEPAALSFALDARRSADAAVRALQGSVPSGTRLEIIRVVQPPHRVAAGKKKAP